MAYIVSGVTRDSGGSSLPGATVKLYLTSDDSVLGEQVSDGSGAYEIEVPADDEVYAVAYLAGSPDVAGATRNDIAPVEVLDAAAMALTIL